MSLVSGEARLTAVDQLIPGRGLDFAVVRFYRSLTLGYGPLGSWHSPLFAHLRELETMGAVEYYDGTGRVWRFLPRSRSGPPPTHDDDTIGAYYPPKGLYLRLVRHSNGWTLYDKHNNTVRFDVHGLMTELSDRHRQGSEEKGNTIRFFNNVMGKLIQLVDDYGRAYHFEYYLDPRPENEGGDGIRYGLLRRITDFAGRTIEYEFDEMRRLVKVRLPEVSNPVEHYASYSYTGENRPTITYRYEPAASVTGEDDNTTAILHGRFAPLRLEGYTLPGSTVLRARLEYELATGRVKTVAFPTPSNQNTSAASVEWGFLYPDEPDTAAPATTVLVRAPWGQLVEYTLAHGRLATVTKQGVPTLAANDPTPGSNGTIPTRTLTTSYSYEDDGRLHSVTYPDGSSTSYTYATGGDRLGRANVATLTRSSSGQNAITTFSYGPDRVLSGEVDPEGRTTTYPVAYNGAQPTPTGPSDGVQTTYTFDSFGRPIKTETAGPPPEVAEYRYKADQRGVAGGGLIASVTAGGVTETFSYDERDTPIKQTTSYGTSTTFRRDGWGRVVEQISGQSTGNYRAVNATIQRAYDATGHLIRERRYQTGVGWVETTWVYNEREQVTSVTQTSFAGSQPGAKTLAEGTTAFSYDAFGRLSTTTSPAGIVTTKTYDAASRVDSTQVVGSGTHRHGFDEMGRLVWTTDGDEGVWRGVYNAFGNLASETSPSGAFTTREFDQAGGIKRESVYADANMSSLLADTHFQVTSFGALLRTEQVIRGGGSSDATIVTERSFDGAGRLTATSINADGQQQTTSFTYQPGTGLLASATDAFGTQIAYFYDGASPWPDRIVTTEPAAGDHPAVSMSTVVGRDAFGRVVRKNRAGTVTEQLLDEPGNVMASSTGGTDRVESRYDGNGLPTTVRHPLIRSETRYGYDLDGRMLSTWVARESGTSEVTSYHYDQAGRMDQRTRPGAATETFSYHQDDTIATWGTSLTNQSGQQLVVNHLYDPANRLTGRTLNREAFTEDELPDGLAPLDFGDVQRYDQLGRALLLASKNGLGDEDVDPSTAITYDSFDTRGLPLLERVGGAPVERRYDALGNPSSVLLPPGIAGSNTAAGYTAEFDHGGRMTSAGQVDASGGLVQGSAFATAFSWGAGQKNTGITTATGLESSFGYDPSHGQLASMSIAADGVSLGGLSYTWDPKRNLKVACTSTQGEPSITSGLDWTAEYDAAGRVVRASAGSQGSLGEWNFGYGKADELRFVVERSSGREDFVAGARGRIDARTGPAGTAVFRYDDNGRRIEDDQFHYLWDWRGRLVQVEAKASEHAGQRVLFTYDALGRLRTRTRESAPDANGERSFIAKRLFTWDGQRLAAEAGLNHQEGVLWRAQYLPGPRWLDDAPLVLVEDDLLGSPSTRLFALIRDEMGTVVGVAEPDGQLPALLARYLGASYGQSHAELGPEVAHVVFDPMVSTLGDVSQEPVEGESVAGALVIRTTLALDSLSLAAGLLVERWTGTTWETMLSSEFAIGADPSDTTALVILSLPAWPKGERYRVMLTPGLTDGFGRALLKEHEFILDIPEDGLTPPRYEHYLALDRDSADAASNTLGGAFPGGQTSGFQGLWSDPLTGMSYARNRWYDPRNASWLSEDPLGAIDSQNRYAFVGWGPYMGTDPMGLEVYLVYREFNSPILRQGYTVIGHFYLAFDETGLNDVGRWRQLVGDIGGQRTPPRGVFPQSETFSFHPDQVRDGDRSRSLAGTLYTVGSYIGYNDLADRRAFIAARDGRPDPNALDCRIWPLGASQDQQEYTYRLANASRRVNNASPEANDMGYYRVLTNNCGTWARWMIELGGLTWPGEATIYNAGGAGIGGVQDYLPFAYVVTGAAACYGESLGRGEYFIESQRPERGRLGIGQDQDSAVVGWRIQW